MMMDRLAPRAWTVLQPGGRRTDLHAANDRRVKRGQASILDGDLHRTGITGGSRCGTTRGTAGAPGMSGKPERPRSHHAEIAREPLVAQEIGAVGAHVQLVAGVGEGGRTSTTGLPAWRRSSSSRMPSPSSPSPSSRAEQSMPSLVSASDLALLQRDPVRQCDPHGRNGYFFPAVTWCAPHTTDSG